MRSKAITAAAFAATLATPALAEEPTTLDYVTTRGVVMRVSGMEIPVTYTADGKFTAMDGAVTGVWKVNGDTMCSTNNMDPQEVCIAYPQGKKPGDAFDIQSSAGPLNITINK